jgi:hypothetical protein
MDSMSTLSWNKTEMMVLNLLYSAAYLEAIILLFAGKDPGWLESCAGILEQSMGARNRVGTGLIAPAPRARICKHLRSPGIDSKDSISQAYVAWRAGYDNPICRSGPPGYTLTGRINSLESIPGLLARWQIRALPT